MSSYSLDINSLPIEMRSGIFHDCVRNVRPGKESIRAPVRISSVCRQWRDESLSFGVLWTYLKYYVDGVPPDWLIEVFDTWLQRSNGAPLNFSLTCHLYSHRSKEDYLVAERIVSMLLDHQRHWGKVFFHWEFGTSPSFRCIRLADMQMLTLLYLYIRLDKGTVGGCINLDQSSKLEYLSLGGELLVEFDNEPILLSTRSVNLDEKFTAQQWRKILNAAPNLTRLRIAVRREPIEDEDRSVISHNLEYLELRGLTSHIVINNLTLPALRWLVYRDDTPRNGGEIFSTFIQRSLPPLNHLEIGGSCANEATVTLILPLLPQLEVLHLQGCAISARLFEVLSILYKQYGFTSTASRYKQSDSVFQSENL